MLEIKSLKKTFGTKKVLKGIDLEVNKGDVVGIIGPSGCGKSTLLRTINLLELPTSGTINFEGENLDFKDNVADDTTIKFSNNSIVVILNTEDPFDVVYSEPVEDDENSDDNINWLVTDSGKEYYVLARIRIPSINCEYPILNETSEELLKIAPCKFWGAEPNEVGNFCIVGHNYRSDKFFSHVPELGIGDRIEITGLDGRTLNYSVYDKYVVDPEDVSCTSQRTNGLKEITLITCTDDSKERVIVKAREVQ